MLSDKIHHEEMVLGVVVHGVDHVEDYWVARDVVVVGPSVVGTHVVENALVEDDL